MRLGKIFYEKGNGKFFEIDLTFLFLKQTFQVETAEGKFN